MSALPRKSSYSEQSYQLIAGTVEADLSARQSHVSSGGSYSSSGGCARINTNTIADTSADSALT